MSVRAVLNTAYTLLAQKADAADERTLMLGKAEDATARQDLDEQLGVSDGLEDVGDESAATNVIELRAWVSRVNATMR